MEPKWLGMGEYVIFRTLVVFPRLSLQFLSTAFGFKYLSRHGPSEGSPWDRV